MAVTLCAALSGILASNAGPCHAAVVEHGCAVFVSAHGGLTAKG